MVQDTDKLIVEQLKTLPVPLQRALTDIPWKNLVAEVAKGSNLDAEKSQRLETEAMLVMYGFESQDDFAKNVIRELDLDPGRAGMIAKNVNDNVFSVVLAKANEPQGEESVETLKSIPENKPETQEIAPKVVVEAQNKSINLIPPQAPAPKPLDLTPSNLPVAKPANMIENKLSQVVSSAPKVERYEGGKDPYREPIN